MKGHVGVCVCVPLNHVTAATQQRQGNIATTSQQRQQLHHGVTTASRQCHNNVLCCYHMMVPKLHDVFPMGVQGYVRQLPPITLCDCYF